MGGPRDLLLRYRVPALAVLLSAMLHAALIATTPGSARERDDEAGDAVYTASLGEAALVAEAPAPATPKPKAASARPRAKKSVAPPPAPKADEIVAEAAVPQPASETPPIDHELVKAPEPEEEEQAPAPELLALAPATTLPDAAAARESFPTQALPGKMKITYALNSSLADGRAVYEWERDGDEYVITGEAQAVGFITSLFLEGRVLQETRGKVTPEGLRPSRFTEQRPGARLEGLEFDWSQGKVTFEKGDEKRSAELKDNTVDWLSMIFQLAHQPPQGESFEIRVFTQRRMYQFKLRVLGEEQIEIPIGKVRTLHLRHENEAQNEYVDVWLSLQHHNMPVKMRYPVARNRFMVDQTATAISER